MVPIIQFMSISTEQKSEIINQYGNSEKDTGSAEVQAALITFRIQALAQHFSEHKKDHHSRRGLLKMVSARRRLLKYLKSCDVDRYKKLIGSLGLRS